VYRRDLLNLLNDPGVIGQKDSLFSTLRPDFVKALVFIQEVTGLTQLNYFPQGVQRGASLLVGEVGVSPKIPHEGGRVGKTAFA
jgi:hypothetical protein